MTTEYILPEFRKYEPLPKLPPLDTVIWEWSLEQVQEWWEKAQQVVRVNQGISRDNRETRALWRRIFEARGGKPLGKSGRTEVAWFREALKALGDPGHSFPSVNDAWHYRTLTLRGEQVRSSNVVGFSPCTLMDVWLGAHRQQKEWQEKQDHSSNEEAILLSMASQLGVDPSGYDSTKAFLQAIRDTAEVAWAAKHYPEGTEMDMDQCDCGSWTVGDGRCSCGNRRMYLEIGGNVLTGFYAYARAD